MMYIDNIAYESFHFSRVDRYSDEITSNAHQNEVQSQGDNF